MPPVRHYAAVSLDLWSTCLLEPPGEDDRLRIARVNYLRQSLAAPDGTPVDTSRIEHALRTVHATLRAQGTDPIEVDPRVLVEAYAKALGTTPTRSFIDLGGGYSAVGFAESPPAVNPEAEALVATLERRRVPVIAITNTARREESWQEFFGTRTGLRFRHIVTSCEVGRAKPHPTIFHEGGARRLGPDPGEILHIGDRWDLDGQGALDAGFGAILYVGQWDSHSEEGYPHANLEEVARAGVPCIRRLDDPRLVDLLA